MKFSTIVAKIERMAEKDRWSIHFARRGSGECFWFDSTAVLCRWSESEKNYKQRFVSLDLGDYLATDWFVIKPVQWEVIDETACKVCGVPAATHGHYDKTDPNTHRWEAAR